MSRENETFRNFRLGIFVTAATVLLVIALYLIGDQQNIFGSTIRISARFNNVSGLREGNTVRFAGIDIGTVDEIEIIGDSTVHVEMIIQKRVKKFIKKNAVASVGTDGVVGNRLINISIPKDHSPPVEDGDLLGTFKQIEMEEVFRTLNTTNENVKAITTDIKEIVGELKNENSFLRFLSDTVARENVKRSLYNLETASNRIALAAGDLHLLTEDLKSGKGTAGALLTDTTLSGNIRDAVEGLRTVSGELEIISKKIREGEGGVGVALSDSAFAQNLSVSMENIRAGTERFNDNMEALQHTWPFRRYFQKKQENGNKRREKPPVHF